MHGELVFEVPGAKIDWVHHTIPHIMARLASLYMPQAPEKTRL